MKKELIEYNPELADKDFIVAFSKSDQMDEELLEEFQNYLKKEFKSIPFTIFSSLSLHGINILKEILWKTLNQKK